MNWKRIAVSLAAGLAGLFLATSPASAQCTAHYSAGAITPSFVGPFTSYLDLNAEGITERSADIVINGVGCFTAGSTLEISFNAVMSVPNAAAFAAGQGIYWNFSDKSGALNINPVSVVYPLSSGGYVTKILIPINGGTVDPSAEVLLKNLRFDVAAETIPGFASPTPYAPVPNTAFLDAFVDTTNPPTALPPFPVGLVLKTINSAGVTRVGWGFENGICPFTACPFPNKGGSGSPGYLLRQARWNMVTNPAWTLDFPFRFVGEGYTTTPNVLDPNFIGQTDLVVDVEDIPSGVTVTMPQKLYICGGRGAILVTWTASNSTGPQTGGAISTIYQTTTTTVGEATLTVDTGTAPSTTACPVTNTIGVVVNDPSGFNADGNQQADLRVVMGPGTTSQFTGDDVSATAIPRYLANITDSNPTREIIGDVSGNPVEYFYLNPTETVLLYPYVTTIEGWDTGIEVANTGLDIATTGSPSVPLSVFGNTGQSGKIDLYFFPTNGTPFEYTVAAGVGRGLNASGNLAAGGDFADLASDLITKAGGTLPFEGYVIAVGHFNFAHGGAYIYNGSGWIGAEALVLGGHCDYDDHTAQPTTNPSGPAFPACTSARQGDITKLPERLEQ